MRNLEAGCRAQSAFPTGGRPAMASDSVDVREHDNQNSAQSIGPDSRQGNNTVLNADAAERIGGTAR